MKYESYLSHHGILGMKWGVRRYQNKDGTRTALGKKRERGDYAKEQQKEKAKKAAKIAGASAGIAATAAVAGYSVKKAVNNKNTSLSDPSYIRKEKTKDSVSKWNEQTIKGGKDKPNKSPAQVVTGEGEKMIRNATDILRVANKNRKRPNRAEGMSDEELRRRVNRIRLENEYNNLTNVDENGMDRALAALAVIGSVAAIAGSAATIAATVKGK